MDNRTQRGRYLFAIAIAAFGIQHFVYAKYAAGLGPPWIPGSPLRACFMGAALVIAGVRIAANLKTRVSATLLGFLLLFYYLLLYVPRLAANVHDPGPWTSGAEILALCGAAWALCEALPGATSNLPGRFLFAITLIVFGVQHLLYGPFVATLIPSWIPGHLFFAYGVGIAFFGATLSILTNMQTRVAATLLGIMFFTWVFILHLPRVLAAPHNGNEWTSMIVALAMSGSSWIVAGAAQKSIFRR
jgi:uncharacterized membrane protein